VAGAQTRDAVSELRRLSEKNRGEAGAAETHRSLNAKGLYQANRAPSAAQGGFGGGPGGFGRGGSSLGVPAEPGGEAAQEKLSLDYFSAAGKPRGSAASAPGYKQVQEAARVQAVAGRVFYKRKDVWFDNAVKPGQKVVRVKALSDAHFQLLRQVPMLAGYASVGDEVVISLGRVAVQVGRESKERLTGSELAELAGGRQPGPPARIPSLCDPLAPPGALRSRTRLRDSRGDEGEAPPTRHLCCMATSRPGGSSSSRPGGRSHPGRSSPSGSGCRSHRRRRPA